MSLSIDEAYRTLAQNEREWTTAGRTPCGWKVGLTTPQAQRHFGTDGPCFGRLFSDMAEANGSTLPSGRFGGPLIEAEIALRLGADWHPEATASELIEETIPAIEIVDSRYPQGPADIGALIADNVSAAGFVLGDPAPFSSGFDFEGCRADVTRNGNAEVSGVGSNCLGSPLSSLAWLANELAQRGRSLRAGEVILTGSLIAPFALKPGDAIRIEFEGLGSVAIASAPGP